RLQMIEEIVTQGPGAYQARDRVEILASACHTIGRHPEVAVAARIAPAAFYAGTKHFCVPRPTRRIKPEDVPGRSAGRLLVGIGRIEAPALCIGVGPGPGHLLGLACEVRRLNGHRLCRL